MPLNSNGTYSYVRNEALSDRRNAIIKAVCDVVPSISGDKAEAVPKGMQPRFDRLSRMGFLTIYLMQHKIPRYTTCNALIGYAAEAAGAKGVPKGAPKDKQRPVDKIYSGPLQLGDPSITGKAWHPREWDRSIDAEYQRILAASWADERIDEALGSVGYDPGPPQNRPATDQTQLDWGSLPAMWWRQKKMEAAGLYLFFNRDTRTAEADEYLRKKILEAPLPQPGDFYALNVPGETISHVGVVLEASSSRWVTADAGQYVMASRTVPTDMSHYDDWINGRSDKSTLGKPYPADQMIEKTVKAQASKINEHSYDPRTGMFVSSADYEKGSRSRPVTGWVNVDELELHGTHWDI